MNRVSRYLVTTLILTAGSLVMAADAAPIRLHPENPHYFQWRGKALALITSAEHYGAVLNLGFDGQRYLETLDVDHAGTTQRLTSPAFTESLALRITRR